ncbi:MAG: hypothetical protein AAGA45_07535, partial [Verrucomicrobiota bacterium]
MRKLARADVTYTQGQVNPSHSESELYGYLELANMVYWQSSWELDANAYMVHLGRSAAEEADLGAHAGQLGIRFSGQRVLLIHEDVDDACVPLSINEEPQLKQEATVALRRLEAQAGNLSLNLADAVDGLVRWDRSFFWEPGKGVRVIDELDFNLGTHGQRKTSWP